MFPALPGRGGVSSSRVNFTRPLGSEVGTNAVPKSSWAAVLLHGWSPQCLVALGEQVSSGGARVGQSLFFHLLRKGV